MSCFAVNKKSSQSSLPGIHKQLRTRKPKSCGSQRRKEHKSLLRLQIRTMVRAPSLACSTCASVRCSHTALAHGIHRVRSGALIYGALLAFREHIRVSLCLSLTVIFSRAFPQSRARRRPLSALRDCSRSWSHVCMLPNTHASFVRRMIAMLINCVAEKTCGSSVTSVAFSPDGTKIVSGSADRTTKVWDSGAPEPSKSPLLGQN